MELRDAKRRVLRGSDNIVGNCVTESSDRGARTSSYAVVRAQCGAKRQATKLREKIAAQTLVIVGHQPSAPLARCSAVRRYPSVKAGQQFVVVVHLVGVGCTAPLHDVEYSAPGVIRYMEEARRLDLVEPEIVDVRLQVSR